MRSLLKIRTILLLLAFSLLAGACAADEAEDDLEDAGAAVEATADEALATGAEMTEDMASEMMTEDMASEMMTEDMASEMMTEDMASEMMTEDMASEMMTEDMASEMMTEDMASEMMTEDEMTEAAMASGDSAEACDTDAILAAIEGGSAEGTVAGMADDPVGTAASNNPVLTTLTQAATAAGLVDTLNSAEALTVFAPTDCAFAAVDPATMDAAMADPSGLLTTVLGYHVIPGEMLMAADLDGEYTSFSEETLTVDGTTVSDQAEILVPDVETANATVHLIDTVMMPPSMMDAAGAEPTETE